MSQHEGTCNPFVAECSARFCTYEEMHRHQRECKAEDTGARPAPAITETQAMLDYIDDALHGTASDFALSFPLVRAVDDLRVRAETTSPAGGPQVDDDLLRRLSEQITQLAQQQPAARFAEYLSAIRQTLKADALTFDELPARVAQMAQDNDRLQTDIDAFNRTEHDQSGAAMVWHGLYQEACQRAEQAEAQLRAAQQELEAQRLREVALQDSIDGCAKRVASLAAQLHAAEARVQELEAFIHEKDVAFGTTGSAPLLALVERWHQEADESVYLKGGVGGHCMEADAFARRECASDLEAALRR